MLSADECKSMYIFAHYINPAEKEILLRTCRNKNISCQWIPAGQTSDYHYICFNGTISELDYTFYRLAHLLEEENEVLAFGANCQKMPAKQAPLSYRALWQVCAINKRAHSMGDKAIFQSAHIYLNLHALRELGADETLLNSHFVLDSSISVSENLKQLWRIPHERI